MTLLEIATVIGQRLGMVTSDPNSRDGLAVRAFVKMRHDQLYRSFLWRDSLIEYVLAIDPVVANYSTGNIFTPYLPSKGVLLLPTIFQHVVACRTSQNKLDVDRPMIFYRVDQDEFTRTGTPLNFMQLAACVWELNSALPVKVQAGDEADNGIGVTFDYLDSDGTGIIRSAVTMNETGDADVATTERIDSVTKPETVEEVNIFSGTKRLFLVAKKELKAPLRQRIRFMPIPSVATTVRVLGKRTPPTFKEESDSPGINGLDAILVALGYYDFCHRDERGGTGETSGAIVEAVGPEFLTRGVPGGFLKLLIDEEVIQAAHNSRILPECGFGDPTYFGESEAATKYW